MDFDVITDVVEAYNQFQISIAPRQKSTLVDFGV